jgi:hypothetical protein
MLLSSLFPCDAGLVFTQEGTHYFVPLADPHFLAFHLRHIGTLSSQTCYYIFIMDHHHHCTHCFTRSYIVPSAASTSGNLRIRCLFVCVRFGGRNIHRRNKLTTWIEGKLLEFRIWRMRYTSTRIYATNGDLMLPACNSIIVSRMNFAFE